MDPNSKEILFLHQRRIKEKKILNKIYLSFYQIFTEVKFPTGKIVEIGSGGGFLKEFIPSVITSDVLDGPNIDIVFSANKIPFKKNSIAAFLMVDVLHHIKDPQKAFQEMERCLVKGGKIIMIEPYTSIWGTLVYKYLHTEKNGFNTNGGWKIKGSGRMSDANPAMAWIIFKRDRKIYEKMFPSLKIIRFTPHTPIRYLISGGLTKFQLLPALFYPIILFLEHKLERFNNVTGMFVTIELKKT